MKLQFFENYFMGYKKVLDYSLIETHPKKEAILRRLEIIEFFIEYGKEATLKAYKVSKSTVYSWMQKLKNSKGSLLSLAPKSKAPIHKRRSKVSPRIRDFILNYRYEHPTVGQVTIKASLDKFCKENKLETVSEATIGRIIRDLKNRGLLNERNRKLTIDARSGKLHEKIRKKRKKLRRNGYIPQKPGDLVQIDTIVLFDKNLKRYIFSAIDVFGRFGFQYGYKTLSSNTAKDFMQKLIKIVPFEIKRIQTDNGLEFEKHFAEFVASQKITHFFNYPRYPKGNCVVERFNRTTQEQYINWHLDELNDIDQFNKGLMEYLFWYNTEKPHQGINKLTPMQYILKTTFPHPKNSNMYRYYPRIRH